MCVSIGAPKKPAYGPCREQHDVAGFMAGLMLVMATFQVMSALKSAITNTAGSPSALTSATLPV